MLSQIAACSVFPGLVLVILCSSYGTIILHKFLGYLVVLLRCAKCAFCVGFIFQLCWRLVFLAYAWSHSARAKMIFLIFSFFLIFRGVSGL